jgi:arabinogalactan oligomer/maltooligosaccharide transport system permease protein
MAAVSNPKETPANFRDALRQSAIPWAFIAPSAIVMALITLYPQLYQVYMAFTNMGLRHLAPDSPTPEIVGIDNFIRVVTSQLAIQNYDFARILIFNIVWTIANVFMHVVVGVMVALALNAKGLWFKRLYRAVFILPWALPAYITALVWKNMYDPNFGAFNLLFAKINELLGTALPTDTRWLLQIPPPIDLPGIAPPLDIFQWLPLAFYAVLLANMWLGWPFMMVIATGALQSIPKELYEAAEVDGASKWHRFWAITVPLIRPAMVPAIMLGTIWTFNQFNVIYFISAGGPLRQTEILVTQAYRLLQVELPDRYGVAAAFSMVVFVILLIITLINNRVTRATEAYNE